MGDFAMELIKVGEKTYYIKNATNIGAEVRQVGDRDHCKELLL